MRSFRHPDADDPDLDEPAPDEVDRMAEPFTTLDRRPGLRPAPVRTRRPGRSPTCATIIIRYMCVHDGWFSVVASSSGRRDQQVHGVDPVEHERRPQHIEQASGCR